MGIGLVVSLGDMVTWVELGGAGWLSLDPTSRVEHDVTLNNPVAFQSRTLADQVDKPRREDIMSWLVEPTCPARAYVASAWCVPLPMAKHPLRQNAAHRHDYITSHLAGPGHRGGCRASGRL
jgi:hypothetical protein